MNQDSGQGTSQKRKNLRAPMIALNIIAEDGNRTFFGYIKNISRGGLFIASVNPRELGSRFNLEISLPQPINRTVQTHVEVVWTRRFSPKSPYEPGMGLRFLDMPEDVALLIDEWVREQNG
ncbi:MAG: PilZ domain-containing protein [Syntrophotaleaceae bacterium]